MTQRWFSDEELRELSTPVISRIARAVRKGDDEGAAALCEELRQERIVLHDFFADATTALFTWVGRNLGEERLYDMFIYTFEQGARRQVFDLLDTEMNRGLEAALVVRGCWVAHCCSGAGEHGGAFRLEEDEEKFTFVMDPCASGGRLWRRGRYEPPYDFGMTSRAYPWTFNREGLPYYCVHCPFLNELMPMQYLGFPSWPVDPPAHAMDECRWYIYKDKWAAPQRFYDRYGLTRPREPRGIADARRWYTEEQLRDIVRPTPDRIADCLARGDRGGALRLCREMGGEFFFLHSLYVSMVAAVLDFIAREAGEERLGEALAFLYDKCVREQIVGLIENLPRREALRFIVHDLFLADNCGGAGYPPARFSVSEDERGVTVVLDPCGSGGKLMRHGSYEPVSKLRRAVERLENQAMRASVKLPLPRALLEFSMPMVIDFLCEMRRPEGLGVTGEPYPWSADRRGVPYYCAMCTSFVREAAPDWLQVVPPGGKRQPCVWRATK